MPKLKQAILLLAVFALGGLAVGGAFAAMHGGDEVRVAARKLDDGRVEVAVQARQADASWGERQLPERRFVPADAEPGRWLSSSAAAIGEAPPPPRAVCIVHHGGEGDTFWTQLGFNATFSAPSLGLALTIKNDPDAARQAQLIRECADEGAEAIATSVPDADALRGAIEYAKDAGVIVITFNSGRLDAESLRVPIHISLNEAALGSQAGGAFDGAGVEGTVLCVLHERNNAGLEERCDTLEAAYSGGEVERFNVAGVGDIERSTEQLRERFARGGVAGALTLNDLLLSPIAAAAEAAGAEVQIGGIGTLDAACAIAAGEVLFAMPDQPWFQADFVLASLNSHLRSLDLGLTVEQFEISPTTQVVIEPFVIDLEAAQGVVEALTGFFGASACE